MKKIPKLIIRRKFKMPHLFLEGIENIEKIIVNELKPRDYKIKFGGFEYENIREIPKNISKTSEFHINTHDPYISIDLERDDATLWTDDDEIKTLGAVEKITDVILKGERKTIYYIILILSNLFFLSVLVIPAMLKRLNDEERFLLVISLSFIYLLILFSWILIKVRYKISLYDFSIVEFINSTERPNFLIRYKNEIFQIFLVILAFFLGKYLK